MVISATKLIDSHRTVTTVRINLSQAVIDTRHDTQAANVAFNGDIGSAFDLFATASAAIVQNYLYYSSYSLLGSTLYMNFPDGAARTFYGVQLANPNAPSGKATSTSNEFVVPGAISFGVAGLMHYDYVLGANGLSFAPSAQSATLNAIKIATHLPVNSAEYDARIGNVSFVVNGNMTMSQAGQMRGTVDKLTVTSDNYFSSSVIDGTFNVSADINAVGLGMAHTAVEGTVTGYRTVYRDGSHFEVSGAATRIAPNDLVELRLMRASAGNDDIAIELPARLYEDFLIDAGAGNDVVMLTGGGGRLYANGGAGNDLFKLRGADGHRIDGGTGVDTVDFAFARAGATIKAGATATAFTVTEASGAVHQLDNVERIAFADGMVALDIEGSAGQAYRLYQAAFDRTPDIPGLSYWIAAMDKGATLNGVAANFMASKEFREAYGSAPTELELVTRFYENILNRAPDASGLDYWMGVLNRKEASSAEVLAFISESAENKAALIGVIGDGFSYMPYDLG